MASNVRSVTMQGWAFFTKSPRDLRHVPYVLDKENQSWRPATRGPNMQARYAFGLNRESRLTEFDIQALIAETGEQDWIDCRNVSKFRSCIEGEIPTSITVTQYDPRLCGLIAITESQPIPWAYRNSTIGMPGKVLYLNVECNTSS
ncbi:SdpA family antimicrobial peptide system protein [Actinomyces slackii]|uniref:SdpA family antimicrobial peptide system protein n=1 Tax=Actinomyces slackii TaxID=52774 RepID=UPI0009FB9699